MNSKEIRELIELVSQSRFKTFELEREGFRLKLVKADEPSAGPTAIHPVAVRGVSPIGAGAIPAEPTEAAPAERAKEDGFHELRSPIVGTFYSKPSPETPDFVEVGTRVKRGQVLCIVEAMKVMNEIESEIDGEVVEVLVSNAQPVEYGEVLFRLRSTSPA